MPTAAYILIAKFIVDNYDSLPSGIFSSEESLTKLNKEKLVAWDKFQSFLTENDLEEKSFRLGNLVSKIIF